MKQLYSAREVLIVVAWCQKQVGPYEHFTVANNLQVLKVQGSVVKSANRWHDLLDVMLLRRTV